MKKLVTSLLFLITTVNIFSQRICSSSFDPSSVQVSDNARYQRYLQTEQFILDYRNSLPPTSGKLINPNSVITIPVVVHVLHGGEAIGVGRNISVAQVQSQIDVLNEDFRRLNANRVNTPAGFGGVAADALFQFQLACIDPNGNTTNGISRRQTTVASFTDNDNIKYTALGGEDAWNTSRYLNLWVSTLQANLLGYAQFPFDFSIKPNTDGVVIRTTSFGRVGNVTVPFHQGRTATHEVGHWLNLFHIWGDDGTACTGSDQCGDTPNQGDENYGCPAFPQASCANGVNGDMFMNYMDYTDDPCMNLFSTDQRIRMRALFSTGGIRDPMINNSFFINPFNTPVCNTSVITLTNRGCIPGVVWSINGPATIVGNGNSATITKTGNGIATVTATAAGYTDSKNIRIGTYNVSELSFSPNYAPPYGNYYSQPYCWGATVYFRFNDPSIQQNATGYQWYYSSNWTYVSGQGTAILCLRANPTSFPSSGSVGVKVSNACGTSNVMIPVNYAFQGNCSGSFTVYPNPGSDVITVGQSAETKSITFSSTEIKEVEMIDKMGKVHYRRKFAKGLTTVNIPVNSFPNDVYTVQIFDGRTWHSHKVVVQH